MHQWINLASLQDIGRQSLAWAAKTLPSFLIILALALAGLWTLGFLLKRLRKYLLIHFGRNKSINTREAEKRLDTLLGIVTMSARTIIWTMIGLILLKKLGVDIAPLLAGAGIVGLAVGFGAQELVRDIISGFFMLLEDQIRTGDVAIINNTGGLVESIGLRTITLRDQAGVVHVFQNGKINSLSNMTKEWSAMVFDIGVAYKEDTDKVSAIMAAVAEELRADPVTGPKILAPFEILGVDNFTDSAIIIKARFKTHPGLQWDVGREYRRRLKKAFDKEGIEIPFPYRKLLIEHDIPPAEKTVTPPAPPATGTTEYS
jgi:small conductance mechanosensitive channel